MDHGQRRSTHRVSRDLMNFQGRSPARCAALAGYVIFGCPESPASTRVWSRPASTTPSTGSCMLLAQPSSSPSSPMARRTWARLDTGLWKPMVGCCGTSSSSIPRFDPEEVGFPHHRRVRGDPATPTGSSQILVREVLDAAGCGCLTRRQVERYRYSPREVRRTTGTSGTSGTSGTPYSLLCPWVPSSADRRAWDQLL